MKSKRESEKERRARQLTFNARQTQQRVQTVVEFSHVAILIDAFMNDNEQVQYQQRKNRRTYRIGSVLRQSEVKTIPYSDYAM